MKEFRDLATHLVKGLRVAVTRIKRSDSILKSTAATADSVNQMNNKTADYIEKRSNDIDARWTRISERLQIYINQLQLAASIHTILSKSGGLLLEADERKMRVC